MTADEIKPFDDMLDLIFNEWCREWIPEEYKEHLPPGMLGFLKKAFTDGWLTCEIFYEK